MTAETFRRLALSFPEVTESSHMDHPDFRVGGKIFATLGYPDEAWAMVKLTPNIQAKFIEEKPDVFQSVSGGWGRQGCTNVHLKPATKPVVRRALAAAWRKRAPRDLADALDR